MNDGTTIAFLGLGQMGTPMAANLVRAGFRVRVWNPTASRTEELAKLGAIPAAVPADATRGSDIMITMLSDGAAVDDAMFRPLGGLDAARPGQVWAQMSTVGVDWTRQLADKARAFGVTYADAPASGDQGLAAAGDLVIFASGCEQARHTLTPVFGALGRAAWLGETGAGTRATLVLNHLKVDSAEDSESLWFDEEPGEVFDTDPAPGACAPTPVPPGVSLFVPRPRDPLW
jgi:3-hydroxyisobutyrate dehydrogenase